MSVESIITENLDIWTSAIKTKSASGRGASNKVELYGIKKLRELILELAVRGQLVPQSSGDETASTLLKKIKIEKNRLIKAKSIKASKIQGSITEIPFEVPENWEWCFLYDLGRIVGGGTPKSGEPSYWCDDGVKWLTPADLYGLKDKYIGCGKRDISLLGLEKSSAQLLPKGSVLFSSRAPIGYVAIASKELATNQGFKSVVPYNIDCSDYIYYFLKRSAAEIDCKASGTTFKEVSGAIVSKILVPLPPLNEQHRIVKRVDELMALCDHLESQSEASIEAHKILVKSLLETLTNAKDADELNESWQRISEHFDVLFTTEDSIDQLKQTILQLAVMGKLVKQNPNDEPATKLLERIAEEKEQLIKDKKIKRTKELPSIGSSEDIVPANWALTRLGSIINLVSGQHLKPTEYSDSFDEEYIPYITGPAEFGDVYPEFSKFTKYKKAVVNEGDILITCKGAGLGKLNIANTDIAISRQLMGIKPLLVDNEYIFKLLTTLYPYFQSKGVGIAIPGISRDDVTDVVVLLPPLKEQNRIVERLKKLEVILKELKERLQSSNKTKCKMCDSVALVRSDTVNADTAKANEEAPKLDDLLETIWGALGSKSAYTGYITPKSSHLDNYLGMMEKSVGLTVLGRDGEKGVKYTRFSKLVSNLKSIVFVEDKLGLSGIPLLGSLLTSILNSFGFEVKLDQKAALVLLCFPPSLRRTGQEILDMLLDRCKQYKLQTIDEEELGTILNHFCRDGLMTKQSNGSWLLKEKFKHEVDHW